MTAIVEVNIVCDGRGFQKPCPTREFLTFPTQSIKTARLMAAREGWRIYRMTEGTGTRAKDSCPKCSPYLVQRLVMPSDDHRPAMTAAQLIGDDLKRRRR